MRILVATTYRNLIGGVERYVQRLLPSLRECGHDVALLYEEPFDPASETIDSLAPGLRAWCYTDGAALASIAEWEPEIVYSQGLSAGSLEDAVLANYPTVFYAHNYSGTCITGRKCHSFPQMVPCTRRFGVACLALYFPRRCGGLHPGTMLGMYQRQSEIHSRLNKYKAILVASQHMYREFETNGVSTERLFWAPLPGPENPLSSQPGARVPGGDLLFVGRMTDIKGARYAVQAAGKAAEQLSRPLRLTLAGDGPERAGVESMAKTLNVTVEFAGWVRASQSRELMSRADLLVVPSVWPEPFGLVGLEAGAVGLPAAGFAVGGIPDWLIPGVSGELAPGDPPTVEGLAAAIVRALADPDHYNQLRLGAWNTARRFSMEAHLQNLERALVGVREAISV